MGRKSKILTIRAHMPKRVSYVQIIEFCVWVPLSDGSSFVIVADVEEGQIESNGYRVAFVGTGVGCPALDCEV